MTAARATGADTAAGADLPAGAVEAIALRVVELMAVGQVPRLLTVEQVAGMLQVTREWVYKHAEELGALRLGNGSKGRMRFDRERVVDALGQRSSKRSWPATRGASRRGERPEAPLLRVGPKR